MVYRKGNYPNEITDYKIIQLNKHIKNGEHSGRMSSRNLKYNYPIFHRLYFNLLRGPSFVLSKFDHELLYLLYLLAELDP